MPTKRVPLRRGVRGRLTFAQEQCLWLGVPADAFADDEHRAEAWARHGSRLMELLARHGRRPQAWWRYDAPIAYPGYDLERSTLFEAGLLSDDERAELVEDWRREFNRAYEPDFGYCTGPSADGPGAEWLYGRAGRLAHFEWADIPRSLVDEWRAERRRKAVVA
jgi:hypothetical protein